jgi:hypothetical protein
LAPAVLFAEAGERNWDLVLELSGESGGWKPGRKSVQTIARAHEEN